MDQYPRFLPHWGISPVVCSTWSLRGSLVGFEIIFPTAVTCSLTFLWLIPPFPVLLLHALAVLPGIISQRNYLYPNSCLQVYFGGESKLRQVIWVTNCPRTQCILCPHSLPPVETTMCDRGGGKRRCLADRESWLPADPYPWQPCWHSFCVSKDG